MTVRLETIHADRINMMEPDLDRRAASRSTCSRKELTDRWDARCSLETIAIRLTCASVSTTDLNQLRQLVSDRAQAAHRNDNARVCDIDRQFHARIIELSGNAIVGDLVCSHHLLDLPESDEAPQYVIEHYHRIIEALEHRDPDQAEAHLVELLQHARTESLDRRDETSHT